MNNPVITPTLLFRIRTRAAKQGIRHQLNDSFYKLVSRQHNHPIIDINEHRDDDAIYQLATARFTMNEQISEQTLHIGIPQNLAAELIEADLAPNPANRNPQKAPEKTILNDQSMWTEWPKLHVKRDKDDVHYSLNVGFILADDTPRGGGIRIKRWHRTVEDLTYASWPDATRYGWQIDRARLA